MNPGLCHAGSRIHKISSTLSKDIGDGGGGGGGRGGIPPSPRLLFCKIVCQVLYSMYSLYAIIKMVLPNEKGCHV